jgi:hypothetical protein
VHLSNEGLSLWYGTPDAHAPDDDAVLPRSDVSLVIGVRPPNPTNNVSVRYRVDGGQPQTLPGRELRSDYQRQAQYYAVTFPSFPVGSLVEYSPQLSNAGRQVPAPHLRDRYPSRFRLAEREIASTPARPPSASIARQLRYPVRMSYVANVAVEFGSIQYVTDTAAGMRVNFNVRQGTVQGEGFRARIAEGAADAMIVRRDGMGMVRIRAVFVTEDGATLDMESGGYVDFGADGYQRALAHRLPDRSPIVVNPLISTRHPKYKWLSAVQCVGVGHTHLDAGQASYDVYAATARDIPATR